MDNQKWLMDKVMSTHIKYAVLAPKLGCNGRGAGVEGYPEKYLRTNTKL